MQEKAVEIRDILKSTSYTIRATAHAAWEEQKERSLIRHALAVSQARIAFIIAYYAYPLNLFHLLCRLIKKQKA